jgi:hypothetical protein
MSRGISVDPDVDPYMPRRSFGVFCQQLFSAHVSNGLIFVSTPDAATRRGIFM